MPPLSVSCGHALWCCCCCISTAPSAAAVCLPVLIRQPSQLAARLRPALLMLVAASPDEAATGVEGEEAPVPPADDMPLKGW